MFFFYLFLIVGCMCVLGVGGGGVGVMGSTTGTLPLRTGEALRGKQRSGRVWLSQDKPPVSLQRRQTVKMGPEVSTRGRISWVPIET